MIRNFSKNIFYRLLFYSVCLIPSLSFFVSRIKVSKFNIDEYQHTYLAWATANFDMVQYRDFWDNHGILYTLFNTLVLKLFKPDVGVTTFMLERYCNLILLLISFYILFEIFYELSSKIHYASFGALFFSYSMISLHGIEVRPDNLQCVFLYSALLLILKALKSNNKKLSFGAGVLMALMLMTNLKSLSAFVGIGFGLTISYLLERSKEKAYLILNLSSGLFLGLLIFIISFAKWGILDDYIKCNIIYNFKFTSLKYFLMNKEAMWVIFGNQYLPLSIACLSALFFLCYEAYQKTKIRNYQHLILASMILYCLIGRTIVLLWAQFDLLYLPLLCCYLSYIIFIFFEKIYKTKFFSFLWIVFILLNFLIAFNSCSKLLNSWDVKWQYFIRTDTRFKDINNFLRPGEYIDYYAGNCAGLGFVRNLSHFILKDRENIFMWESIEKKEVYNRYHISELNRKKVRLIIGTPIKIFRTPHQDVKNYIFKNYKYYDCIWERVTPFTN